MPLKPMLAHRYDRYADRVIYPAYVNPKYDGFRAMLDENGFYSRNLNRFPDATLSHLAFNPRIGYALDGELVLPRPYLFQDTASAIRTYREDLSPLLEFRVFDVVCPGLPYSERLDFARWVLRYKRPRSVKSVKMAPVRVVKDELSLMKVYKELLYLGYEGAIIRHGERGYCPDSRDIQLLKLKPRLDSEFLVVDIIEGKGKCRGTAVLICETPEGKTFEVAPAGDYTRRREIWVNRKVYVNRMWTIQYQHLHRSGIPRFSMGLHPREEFDLPETPDGRATACRAAVETQGSSILSSGTKKTNHGE